MAVNRLFCLITGIDQVRGEGRVGSEALPSARTVAAKMREGETPAPSTVFSSMAMQWGQFITHEITHTPEATS